MSAINERDAMICRACGNEERASEGYPCVDCGTFICVMCDLRGIVRCRVCEDRHVSGLGLPPQGGDRPSAGGPRA